MAIINMLIGILTAFFVYTDAKKRGHGAITAILWSAGSVVVPYVFLPLYLIFGRKVKQQEQYYDTDNRVYDNDVIDIEATVVEETISCKSCGNKVKEEMLVCPYCQGPTGTSKKDD